MFFSFDGIDGVGKTTQMDLFCEWLRLLGHEIVVCRDPGSTDMGEKIRALILHTDEHSTPLCARAEMLLYMAARTQLVEEVIRPALTAGKIIVSDRYLLANVVYQGYAGGMDIETVWRVGDVAIDGIWPDAVFLLDMDPIEANKRMDRELDRIEKRGLEYRARVREGFVTEALDPSHHIHKLDAAQTIETIHQQIRDLTLPLLVSV